MLISRAAPERHPVGMPTERLRGLLARVSAEDGTEITQLCAIATDISGTSGAGIMVMASSLARGTLHTSDEISAYLGDLQYTLGEGPAVEVHRLGRAVLEADLELPALARWPGFVPLAIQAGARAIFAFPIHIGAVRFGALVLYRRQLGALENEQYTDSLVMATVIAHTSLALQADAPPGGVALGLEIGANFHFVVHQAAGMTSVQMQIDVAEALVRLRGHAFRMDRSVDEVSRDVVARRLRIGESNAS
jgi:hypothetical protein